MIDPSQSDQMIFEPILAKQGDILLMDAFVPHGSGDNTSDRPRRCLVFSFNRLDDGNFNKGFYLNKYFLCSITILSHRVSRDWFVRNKLEMFFKVYTNEN